MEVVHFKNHLKDTVEMEVEGELRSILLSGIEIVNRNSKIPKI